MREPPASGDDAVLVQAYLEGALAPEDAARLHQRLLKEPTLAETLLAELRTDALLREANSAADSASSKIVVRDFRPRPLPSWKWLALAAALVALLVPAGIFLTAPAARLASMSGEVTVRRGTEMLPARAAMRLRAGDVVRTMPSARAEVAFRGESTRLRLMDATELALNQIAGGKRLELRWGRIEAAVAPQPVDRPLVIATRQALAEVLGTRLTLSAGRNGAWLRVEEGAVKLRKLDPDEPDAVVAVGAGQFAVAAPGVAQ